LDVSAFDLGSIAANLRASKMLGCFEGCEADVTKSLAIIDSMTPKERSRPEIVRSSRRDRIARGSGTSRAEVDQLMKQVCAAKTLLNRFDRSR